MAEQDLSSLESIANKSLASSETFITDIEPALIDELVRIVKEQVLEAIQERKSEEYGE